jgi:hypothetical protein
MAYGGAGLCPDFVLRAKKCKITAKIGKKLEKKFKGSKTLPWTKNFLGQKSKKNCIKCHPIYWN